MHSATPNANGNSSANLAAAKTYELKFDIAEEGNYIISFKNNGSGFDEFLLLDCRLNSVIPAGIAEMQNGGANDENVTAAGNAAVFSITGIALPTLQRGLNIVRTRDGKTRKWLKKE